MNERTLYFLCFAAILGTGMVAGVFLAFSSFIMQALSRLPAEQGIGAMQQINLTVINPLFMGILFGSAGLCLLMGYAAWRGGLHPQNQLLLIASVLYLVGVIGVTLAFNVPLNDVLADVEPQRAADLQIWTEYLKSWTRWNSVRGFAACAACLLFIRSICLFEI
jgi:uncharacterized membrane protein